MNRQRQRSNIGPLYPLEIVKRDVASTTFRFATSMVQTMRAGVGDWSDTMCHGRIRLLVHALVDDDFAWVETFVPRGGVVNADVYGKRDDLGLWFIKFAVLDERTRLFSCHLAEQDMTLKNGTTLKVIR